MDGATCCLTCQPQAGCWTLGYQQSDTLGRQAPSATVAAQHAKHLALRSAIDHDMEDAVALVDHGGALVNGSAPSAWMSVRLL